MDIRDWPLGRIMQLPDNCFGRRWPVGISALIGTTDPVFDICEAALPERMVVWDVSFTAFASDLAGVICVLALGDQLPATAAEFALFELMFGGVVGAGANYGAFHWATPACVHQQRVRTPFHTMGRRVVGQFVRAGGTVITASAVLTISSVPTEVPDCLLSV